MYYPVWYTPLGSWTDYCDIMVVSSNPRCRMTDALLASIAHFSTCTVWAINYIYDGRRMNFPTRLSNWNGERARAEELDWWLVVTWAVPINQRCTHSSSNDDSRWMIVVCCVSVLSDVITMQSSASIACRLWGIRGRVKRQRGSRERRQQRTNFGDILFSAFILKRRKRNY